MRGGCGSDVVLETVNATPRLSDHRFRFPAGRSWSSRFAPTVRSSTIIKPTEVPVLYGPEYWLSAKERQTGEFIDYFIGDPSLVPPLSGDVEARSRRPPTNCGRRSPIQKIRAFAHVLDFYGGMFEIRDGKAVVPGGARTEKAWAELAGVSPDKGAAFFETSDRARRRLAGQLFRLARSHH